MITTEVRTNELGSIIMKVHIKFCVSILLIFELLSEVTTVSLQTGPKGLATHGHGVDKHHAQETGTSSGAHKTSIDDSHTDIQDLM